jgi:hypothetical protein
MAGQVKESHVCVESVLFKLTLLFIHEILMEKTRKL